jgi:hypothetical protein
VVHLFYKIYNNLVIHVGRPQEVPALDSEGPTTMSATLSLTRKSIAIEFRRGDFAILLDGKDAGSITYGETVEAPLEPGRHTLRIRKGRYSSQVRSFDATDGEIVSFRCSGGLLWPRFLVSLLLPDFGILLKRE